MGVQGLWTLVEPVGRQINVEALGGKRMAVDASIWLVQLLKAMRDERGEVLRQAHLVGFFRRICKLLFYRIKPVFVFDGATPALKRATTADRRRRKEVQARGLKKTAEKLLINLIKQRELGSLLEGGALPKDLGAAAGAARPPAAAAGSDVPSTSRRTAPGASAGADALLASQLNAGFTGDAADDARVAQHLRDGEKGKGTAAAPIDLDAGAGAGEWESDSDSGDWEEEIGLNPTTQKLDPEVLSTLPPSMQLEFMEKYKEQQAADNRQKFRDAQAPMDFSKLQMQSFLKTVSVKNKLDSIKDAINNENQDQGRLIASEQVQFGALPSTSGARRRTAASTTRGAARC